jgi:tryptophan-rich sensory protein
VRRGRSILGLAGWLALSFAAAAVGRRFEPGPWYAALAKPAWTPPSWVFPPVWAALYLLMGIAAWLIWRTGGARSRRPLALFAVQLALNAAWSWLFFGEHRIGAALLDIVLLWVAIRMTASGFFRVRPAAGVLLLPYLAWVTFAAALNASIWRLNAGRF